MSDIHGCFDEMMKMLQKIEFGAEDSLILAGDYVDRGPKTYELLSWIENCPENVTVLKGNHDHEFPFHIDLLERVVEQAGLDGDTVEGTIMAYNLLIRLAADRNAGVSYFDYYGTIGGMLNAHDVTVTQLSKWSRMLQNLPYVEKRMINGEQFIIAHAGYTEETDFSKMESDYESPTDFNLFAREDGIKFGGAPHSVVIFGHTPTVIEGEFPYNDGNVFCFYDEEKDCTFYDIDCGCVFGLAHDNAKLACIRLEDEAIFYVKRTEI